MGFVAQCAEGMSGRQIGYNGWWLFGAGGAEALDFDLVGLGGEVVAGGEGYYEGFEFMFVDGGCCAAVGTGEVVMVGGELVGEFDFVFPAGVEPLEDAELFEEVDCSVNAGAVDGWGDGHEFVHSEGLFA